MVAQQLDEQIAQHSQICNHLKEEVGRVLVGQDHMLSRLLIGLLTGGHILLEGVPGLAKTLTVRSLATAIDTGFLPHPVHARHAAVRRDRHGGLQSARSRPTTCGRARSSRT